MTSPTPKEPTLDPSNPSQPPPKPEEQLSITTNPPIPYTFTLTHLLIHDPTPLPPHPTNQTLTTTARTAAQALLNQLLTTCPIRSTPTGVHLTLPPATPTDTLSLPRAKPVPQEKGKTKWQVFAQKKGIKPKSKGEGKQVYDEEKGEWVRKWGYKGRNKEGEGDWLVEVDEKRLGRAEEGGRNVRGEGRRERVERVRRNERRMRANEKRGGKGGTG